jgi:hypothetical protein
VRIVEVMPLRPREAAPVWGLGIVVSRSTFTDHARQIISRVSDRGWPVHSPPVHGLAFLNLTRHRRGAVVVDKQLSQGFWAGSAHSRPVVSALSAEHSIDVGDVVSLPPVVLKAAEG